jgi:putative aldouronate transport system permease protein
LNKKLRYFKRSIPFYIMFLPAFIYFLINNYLPMFGIIMAFKNVSFRDGIINSPWVGLTNFKFLFASADAWLITRNTVLYNVVFLVLGQLLGIFVGICLSEVRNKKAARVYQTLILLPHLMSMVIVSYLANAILNENYGLLNRILVVLGGEAINWYADAAYWPYILTIIRIWASIGFSSVIYLSSIVGINEDYYEAACLDGANKWQQIRHITLPLIKPTTVTLIILGMGQMMRSDFGLFYLVPLNTGALFRTTQTIDTYVYRALMTLGNTGMSAAAGFYQSIVGFLLILGANWLIRKLSRELALF